MIECLSLGLVIACRMPHAGIDERSDWGVDPFFALFLASRPWRATFTVANCHLPSAKKLSLSMKISEEILVE